MSSTYYLVLTCICLAIGIYNFSTSSSGKNLNCYNLEQMDYATYLKYNETFSNSSNTSSYYSSTGNSNSTIYTVKVSTSNLYSTTSTVIGILYLIITVFSVFLAVLINYLANQLPEDFLNMGRCKRWIAASCKILPLVNIVIHWIIFILIIVMWTGIASSTCIYSTSTQQGVLVNSDQYFINVRVLNIVNSCLWLLIHVGGMIIKEIVYQEPFNYWPEIGGSKVLTFFCKTLGP